MYNNLHRKGTRFYTYQKLSLLYSKKSEDANFFLQFRGGRLAGDWVVGSRKRAPCYGCSESLHIVATQQKGNKIPPFLMSGGKRISGMCKETVL